MITPLNSASDRPGGYTGRGLHGQVVELLGTRIVSGALPADSPLDLAALGIELDISRTVLREAMKVLAAKGLVDARQKRGTYVRPRAEWNLLDADVLRWQFIGDDSLDLLDQLAEARSIVEPASARLAAVRRTDDDLAALSGALERMREAGVSGEEAIAADLEFHRALRMAAHNEVLTRMAAVLEVGLAARNTLVHGDRAASVRAADPVPSHQAVFMAIRAGVPEAAEEAMRRLLDRAVLDVALCAHQSVLTSGPSASPEGET